MATDALINEIKLMELKLQALKAKVLSAPSPAGSRTVADLYGILKGADDITPEDVDAVRIKLRERGM